MAGRIGKPCGHCGRFCGEGDAPIVAELPRRRFFLPVPRAAAPPAVAASVAAGAGVGVRRPSRGLLAALVGALPLSLLLRARRGPV